MTDMKRYGIIYTEVRISISYSITAAKLNRAWNCEGLMSDSSEASLNGTKRHASLKRKVRRLDGQTGGRVRI